MNISTPDSAFFKTFLHQCNDLVVITDRNALVSYVNPAFEKHTGYSLRAIKGKNISVVKSGVHNRAFYEKLWDKLKKGTPQSCVFINKKKNGELYYEHKTITPIKDSNSRIEYYLSTSKDVTGELKLQRELIKQKNFIHSVVQGTDALIIGMDNSYRITLFNNACEKLTGYGFNEVKGKSIFEMLVPGTRASYTRVFDEILKENCKFLKSENTIRTKNGRLILVSWSHTLISDEEGSARTILSTGINVTKERVNEKKLVSLNSSLDKKVKAKTQKLTDLNKAILLQNEFIKKINRALPAMVYLLDLGAGTIRLFNNRINKKIYFPEAKDTDIQISRFFRYIDHQPGTNYESIFLTPTTENVEIPFLINGKSYWFQNRSIVFEKNDRAQTEKILGFISDITKTRFIQSKLEESQEIAKIGNWEWNLDTNRIYWSDEIYRIFEIDKNLFKPSYAGFLKAIHPEDKKRVIDAINRSLVSKTPYEIIHRLREKNNTVKYVHEKGYTQYGENGVPLRMIGTVQDVTQKKKLKDELRSAYVTLQNCLNAIITTDLDGNILFANNAALRMWGYKDNSEITRNSVLRNWSEKHRQEIRNIKKQALQTGFYFSEIPFSSIKEDGTQIDVKFNLSLIIGEDKKPQALTWSFFDVTDLLRNEKLVKEYDEKISLLLGNIDEVVFGIDAVHGSYTAGKPFFVSAKSQELMGFTLKDWQLKQDLWQSLIHWDDLEKYCNSNLECIKNKCTVTRTYRIKHMVTGKYRWFEEKITPYYDHSGELSSYYGSARDVTERIIKDRQLKESEEKYRLLSENNHDFVSLRDEKGNALFVSNAINEVLGYTVEEYLQTNLFEILHPDDRERVKQSTFIPNFEHNEKGFTEGRLRHKNGHWVWIQTVSKPVLDEKGNVTAAVGSSRDITERKMLQDAINESEKKYRSIFENALAGIFRANLVTGKPVDANGVCVKLFGFDSKEDFLENFDTPNRYFDAETREAWRQKLLANPANVNEKIRFRKKDGSLFWGYTSAKILPGESIMEGVVIDVTKNHEFEEQLKKNLTEKELLLKEIHHRVKNNLQVISSLLKLQLNKLTDPAMKRVISEGYDRIHAIALVHEKLYLSEDVATINFSEYLANLTRSIHSIYPEKRVATRFDLQPFHTNINLAIPLGLVCHEILSNAFKHAFYLPAEYELDVAVTSGNKEHTIVIRDSGDGFNTGTLESSQTLGWKLITSLARQAKAAVTVSSIPGAGTSFKIVVN